MAKNMTRKGLAFGAAIALGATGIATTPALAVGMPDNTLVSLAPNAGTAYTVFTDSVFDIDANFASSVAGTGKDLKFRITDAGDKIKVDIAHDGTADTIQTATVSGTPNVSGITVTNDAAGDFVTISTVAAHGISTGDVISVADAAGVSVTGTAWTADQLALINGTFVVTAAVGTSGTGGTYTIKYRTGTALMSADSVSATLTAVTLTELTESDALDTRANILFAPLGSAGLISDAASVVDTRSTDDFIVVDSNEDANTADVTLRLVADTAESYSATVVAWIDNNDNNKIDSTEYASPERVVNFKKVSEIVPTLTFDPILVGDATITATVSTEPKINFDMVGNGAFAVDFQRQGSAQTVQTAGYTESWDDDDSEYTVTQTINNTTSANNWADITLHAQSAAGTYTQSGTTVTVIAANTLAVNDVITVATQGVATAKKVTAASATGFTYTADASATVAAGTAFAAASVTVNSYAYAVAGTYKATVKVGTTPAKIGSTFEIAAGTAVAASVANKATVTSDVNSTFKVRKGYTGAVTVTTTVKNSAGVAVAAGVPVTIAASETSAGAVTVNGTAVTTSKSIAATTDANGQVVMTVTNAAAAAGDTVTLNVTSQGYSDSDTLTWEAAQYLLTDANDPASTKALGRSILSGGTASFDVTVKDQFNTLLSGEARVKVVLGGTRWSATSYETITAGKATINIVDTPVNVADLSGEVTFTLQQKNTAGSWVDADGTSPTVTMINSGAEINGEAVTVNIRSANGSSVSINADSVSSADLAVASATVLTAASDLRNAETAADFSTETGDVTATITGTVKDGFTGVGQGGAAVTVSGDSSILFRAGDLSAFGSITFFADASTGVFTVDAFSNKAQTDSVVTVASNGATATAKVTFGAAAATAGTSLVITAPEVALPGSTMTLKAKLTDKYGNAVQVTDTADILVTYVGPGIVFGTLPTTTDKYGELSVSVLLGSNDSGTATITVSYDRSSDGDFTGTTAADLDLVVSKSVIVGASAANVASWTKKLDADSAKIYAKNIVGAGKVQFFLNGKEIAWVNASSSTDSKLRTANGASYLVRTVEFAAGKNVLEVYVDGVRTTRTAYTK